MQHYQYGFAFFAQNEGQNSVVLAAGGSKRGSDYRKTGAAHPGDQLPYLLPQAIDGY